MAARRLVTALSAPLVVAAVAFAGVGDPQIRTDHPYYPGELACSTFPRLFAHQAEMYRRIVGVEPTTDEQKAVAAWLWRNTHYWHGEEGAMDWWGKGFTGGGDMRTREYWTGLFAHGFGLCGTTHSQWIPEINARFGHNRGRGVGVEGHNSFEVFLKGGPYGDGKWVLLDHDISTIIYNDAGSALLSIPEVKPDWKRLTDRGYRPDRQNGWLVCGLHPGDGGVYARFDVAEYLAGYAGPPPMIHLRRGETLRRYLEPGLEDGRTFVFWGRNYNSGGIPGPERNHTWVNQAEKMYKSRAGAGARTGQARYANAVYTYKPDFAAGGYKDAVVQESDSHVVLEFLTPYIIAATPAGNGAWDIYKNGCRNGLVLRGSAGCAVSVSIDRGRTWKDAGMLSGTLDLTDHVKGRKQYLLKLAAPAQALAGANLTIVTVCQMNSSVIPRLKDGGTKVTYEAGGHGLVSAGPELETARTHVVAGGFGSPTVTLAVESPRREPAVEIVAAAHVASGNPPRPEIKYRIEYSTDAGKTWRPIVADWSIPRQGVEPKDFWSQSLCWGSTALSEPATGKVLVRFSNSGGRQYLRAEAHLVYKAAGSEATNVTFAWTEDGGAKKASHVFRGIGPATWDVPTGRNVKTRWVEFEAVK
jgi:hypothetical protein